MNILVLGGNGYLGSKIINELLSNDDVFCTVRKGEGLNLLVKKENTHIISDDVDEIKSTIEKNDIDVLINTVCCYERQGIPLSSVVNANLMFPLSIIMFALEHGVKKIITIDTSLPKNVNLYSLTKKAVADIGEYYTKKNNDLVFYNVLLENFYGKDEPKNRFLHIMVQNLKDNKPLDLTAGTQRRDFIYVDDVLAAFKILINNNDYGFHNVPIGTGEGPTIRNVIEYLKEITNSNSQLNFGAVPSRENEPDCIADLSYLKQLGFEINYPYKKGLKEII